jgi:DNA-binding response OmpR family regulator
MNVLLVEDEALVALDMQDFIERLGHRVTGPIRSMAEARAIGEADAPDAALVDLNLGRGEFGPDIARYLQRRFGTVSLFVTGNADQARAHSTDACGVLSKPVVYQALVEAMRCLERLRGGQHPGTPRGFVLFADAV